jgi:hypothetical protein
VRLGPGRSRPAGAVGLGAEPGLLRGDAMVVGLTIPELRQLQPQPRQQLTPFQHRLRVGITHQGELLPGLSFRPGGSRSGGRPLAGDWGRRAREGRATSPRGDLGFNLGGGTGFSGSHRHAERNVRTLAIHIHALQPGPQHQVHALHRDGARFSWIARCSGMHRCTAPLSARADTSSGARSGPVGLLREKLPRINPFQPR